jgi:citrate lyase subunit beta/citryl-CoA lyase
VAPPLDTPFLIDLKDIEALKADAARGRQMGFQGKLCIHPNQVGPCNEVFSPTEEEIHFSERVIQAFEEAESEGSGAIQLDGKFIDYPVVERSRRVLKMAAAIQS